jgi:hypothetical protein
MEEGKDERDFTTEAQGKISKLKIQSYHREVRRKKKKILCVSLCAQCLRVNFFFNIGNKG